MSTKEKNMDERIAFGNSLSEKRRESGFAGRAWTKDWKKL